MNILKNVAIWAAILVAGCYIVFHTNFIISRASTYDDWYRRFLSIELTGEREDANAFVSIDDTEAIISDYIRRYHTELFDTLLFGGRIRPTEMDDFQNLVSRQGDNLILVNVGPMMELPDNFMRNRWESGVAAVRRSDKAIPPRERAFFEFAMMHFEQLVIRNPYNKTSTTADTIIDLSYQDRRDTLRF